MSSYSTSPSTDAPAVPSSSRTPPSASPTYDDYDSDDDNLDLHSQELLNEDPLHDGHVNENVSFRRNVQQSKPSFASRFLSSPFTTGRNGSTSPAGRNRGNMSTGPTTNTILSYLNSGSDAGMGLQDTKDASGLDWYVEGPGRRVGYDNLTAIDWIYEYSKERMRLQNLFTSTPGFLGQLRVLADASHIWLILIATGIAVGGIAAGIDVASDWMGDMKTGICSNVDNGGKFYLNKTFCCWGEDSMAECKDWRSWGALMGVGNNAGGYIIEYIVFVLFSVSPAPQTIQALTVLISFKIFFATVASYLVVRFSPYAKQSGIPEIKTVLGGFVIRRFLGAWTLAVKSIGLCLAVASGMWLGKEGPLVHVACCCANLFMKLFPSINGNEARKREVLSAAAASGISVAFGSPIGGVLFSLEQLSYYFPDKTMWASFVCAMVAAVTLQAFDPFRTGKIVLYQVTYHSGWHAFELLPFAVIGILGGLYGGFFIKLNLGIASYRKSNKNPFQNRPVLEVMAVALLTAAISFPVTFLRAQSSELVEALFSECKDIVDDELGLCKSGVANTGVLLLLLLSSLIGSLLASFTFGLQIPAGILLPSMAVGALFGRSIGLVVELAQQNHSKSILFAACEPDIPCVTPGTYAVIGAAAALAGATRMTVSIVVIMFELTGALTYVLPIMIAVMLAKWTGDAIHSQGIYESWIQLNGYPYLDQTSQSPVPEVPISQLMTRAEDLVNLTAVGHTIGSLRALLQEHHFRGFPVVASHADQTLLGYISRTELSYALSRPDADLSDDTEAFFTHQALADPTSTVDLRPWMDQTPITLNEHASLMLTSEMFQKLGLRYILFVARGELRGFMTKKDLWLVLSDGAADRVGHEGGVLREHTDGEREDQRGLLDEGQP